MICLYCEKEFEQVTNGKAKKFCNHKCRNNYHALQYSRKHLRKHPIVKTRECKGCGKTFDVAPKERGITYYCSPECRIKNEAYKRAQKVSVVEKCNYCGNHFNAEIRLIEKDNIRYCSRKCYRRAVGIMKKDVCECDDGVPYTLPEYRKDIAKRREQYVKLDNWNNAIKGSKSGYCRCCGKPINKDKAFQNKFCDYKCYRNYYVNKVVVVSYAAI